MAQLPVSHFFSSLALLTIVAVIQGCAATSRGYSPAETSALALTAVHNKGKTPGFDGLWQGKAISSCGVWESDPDRCHAVVNIAITMLQEGPLIHGFYKCTAGNMMCRDADSGGVIKNVSVRGDILIFRVMMSDGSSCIYDGQIADATMTGGFTCIAGLGLTERGRWRVTHIY
ncbi:MAG: hypothetical protein ACREP6_05525 [Candidatus Binataceae bacterium]